MGHTLKGILALTASTFNWRALWVRRSPMYIGIVIIVPILRNAKTTLTGTRAGRANWEESLGNAEETMPNCM